MPFEPFNLGQVIQTAEAIKGMRRQSVTDDLREQYLGEQIEGMRSDRARQQRIDAVTFGKEQAAEIYRQASAVLQPGIASPKNFVEQNYPEFVAEFAKHGDWATVDEDGVRQMAREVMAKAGAEAGIAPQAPIKVGAGDTLLDPSSRQPIYSQPANSTVRWVDDGSQMLPRDSKTGQDVPGVAPIKKTLTPTQQNATGDGLNDAAKQLAVDRLLSGEKPSSVLGNLGRGAQGARDLRAIQNLLADTAGKRGITGPQLVKIMQSTAADGRAVLELGAREGKIAARVQEAQNFAQIAKAASAEVPRSKFLPWNKLKQIAETNLSDPKLARLKAATVSLVNAYAAAVGGGTPTVHDKEAAENMLATAQSPEAYDAVVDQLITETEQALAAPEQVRERMTGIKPQGGSDLTPAAQEVTASDGKGNTLVLRNGQWVKK